MTYEETLEWLYRQLPMFQRQGPMALKLDLSRMYDMMDLLGNPQDSLTYIHIAGTNGKGSCSHILASVLQSAGKKVGLYTSPHYKDFRERIKINGSFIPKDFVTHFVEEKGAVLKDLQPSFFELTFCMAIQYFAEQQPDIVILETGLGGRLDSTNIVKPIACLITNIGYDHQQFLGDTLPEIAFEKAGIIKAGVPVLIGEHQEEVAFVFEQVALELKAELKYAKAFLDIERGNEDRIQLRWDKGTEEEMSCDLGGPFALKNIRSSLALLSMMAERIAGFEHVLDHLEDGLKQVSQQTYYIGRWMIPSRSPLTVLDSAHNVEGITIAMEEINRLNRGQLHIVFATVGDKDASAVLSLLPDSARYFFTQAKIPRAKDARVLMEEAGKLGLSGSAFTNAEDALSAAVKMAKPEDTILALGSIFLVAELI